MLFRQKFLAGIEAGSITLAFRRWRRPTVKAGGTLLTAIGQLTIGAVTPIDEADISDADARRAGFESRGALLHDLNLHRAGTLYRVELGALRADPRVALRTTPLTPAEAAHLTAKLDQLDRRSPTGPWTRQTLDLIAAHPARRAGDLCQLLGMEQAAFKTNVRKLKALGLTESLGVGYRLSPRGERVRTGAVERR